MDFSIEETLHTNKELFEKQKQMLRDFLEKGAITEQQYMVSMAGLREKMKV